MVPAMFSACQQHAAWSVTFNTVMLMIPK